MIFSFPSNKIARLFIGIDFDMKISEMTFLPLRLQFFL